MKYIYKQISGYIKALIISEKLKPSAPLPSIRYLAKHFNVNNLTVQRAYQLLEQEGYVYSIKGKGKFVKVFPEKTRKERELFIKGEIKQIVNELIYLGICKEEIISIIPTTKRFEI